jgi:hypothetical protein
MFKRCFHPIIYPFHLNSTRPSFLKSKYQNRTNSLHLPTTRYSFALGKQYLSFTVEMAVQRLCRGNSNPNQVLGSQETKIALNVPSIYNFHSPHTLHCPISHSPHQVQAHQKRSHEPQIKASSPCQFETQCLILNPQPLNSSAQQYMLIALCNHVEILTEIEQMSGSSIHTAEAPCCSGDSKVTKRRKCKRQ